MPQGPAALVQVDVKALREGGMGRKVIEALVEEQDPMRPLLMKGIDALAVAMSGADGAWAYGVIACRSCSLESLAGCLAADFGLSFNLEKSAALDHGRVKLFPSDTDPPVVMGKVGKGLFVLGPAKHAAQVVDVIEGRAPSLAGSSDYADMKKGLPASAAASLLIFDPQAARTRAFGPENELARELMKFETASLGMKTGDRTLEMQGTMMYGPKQGEAAGSAKLIRKTLEGFASNPILRQFGLAHYLEKIKIKQIGGRSLGLAFSVSEAEIFELVESRDKIFTLGL